MEVEHPVGEQDEEDRKDVDHADPRLHEEHPVKAREQGRGGGEEAIRPQAQREQVEEWNHERAEEDAHDPEAERREPEVRIGATRLLEGGSPPAVEPLARRDDQLAQRRLWVEVVLADQVLVREVAEVDLVEDLAVGRREGAVARIAALVRITQPAQRAQAGL